MIDLKSVILSVLNNAGYETWLTSDEGVTATCFEDSSVMGFIVVYDDVQSLLTNWSDAEAILLRNHAKSLQQAGEKTWNIYSVFLTTSRPDETQLSAVRRIEEDLQRTRKIAACDLNTREEVVRALLPVLPLQYEPLVDREGLNLTRRLKRRIESIAPSVADAALDNSITPTEVVRLLGIER